MGVACSIWNSGSRAGCWEKLVPTLRREAVCLEQQRLASTRVRQAATASNIMDGQTFANMLRAKMEAM